MGSCCGRPDNRANKGGNAADYYSRYAYLSSHQRAQQAELVGSKCSSCDALTMSNQENKCTTCGTSKAPSAGTETKEG